MRFKVDENLHHEIAELLNGHGHDALTVFDQGLRGRSDKDISDICQSEHRILLSLDLDFSNVLLFPPEHHPGLIVLRLRKKGRSSVRSVVAGLIRHLEKEAVTGRLLIVEEHRIRIHQLRRESTPPD
jgi:predicted nuclease of predicted toxin-antitoxin system